MFSYANCTGFHLTSEPANNQDIYREEMALFQHDDGYRIKLSVFEGPIDLLLYLIKKKELDIHEISLSEVAKEYMEYVELIKLIDLERAGDFIVVASTLMKIKSRSLFSSTEDGDELSDETDTKNELIRYLMEFEKFGSVTEKLAEKEEARRGVFPRGGEKNRIAQYTVEKERAPDYMLFDLFSALQEVMKTAPQIPIHEVELLNVTSEMKQREIMAAIGRHGKVDFIKMVQGQPKLIIVVTFIALLDLIKSGEIRVRQLKQFGRIILYRKSKNESKDN